MSYYPKWKYHRTLPACIVADAAAEAALGPDWADTPAAFAAEPEQEPQAAPDFGDAAAEEAGESEPRPPERKKAKQR